MRACALATLSNCCCCCPWQVRYDKSVGEDTAMKFMTDGILLRELQEDFLLSKYR